MRYYTTKDFASVTDLNTAGYIQEANRRFFHPLGLHLALSRDSVNEERFLGFIDCRDDPEGIVFTADEMNADFFKKIEFIDKEFARISTNREKTLGSNTQGSVKLYK